MAAQKTITITVSKTEFDKIEKKAAEIGISTQQYIRICALEDTGFLKYFTELKIIVEGLPSGKKFNIKMLLAMKWEEIPIGMRLSLGRNFFNQVQSGGISGVVECGKNSANLQQYKKL